MESGQCHEAKIRINQIFALLRDCAKKGVCDTDGALIRKDNLGFLGDKAIYIDAGKLRYKRTIKQKTYFVEDLKRLRPLRKWLDENHPSLVRYFDEEKERVEKVF